MITDIIMRNCASYDSVGAQIANCAKINFIYGPNGSGKSTVSNFLRDPSNEMYEDSEIKWSLGDRSELIVYNRRFREANFGSCDIPGVFTLGEGAIEEIKKVEDLKNNRQKLVEERDKREGTKSREESKKLDRISLFRENIWALREKEHISFLRQAFAGYLNSKEKFMGEVLRRFELGIGTDINLEELKSGAEMLLGDKPEKSPKFTTNFDEITSALLAVEVDSIWNTVVIGNEDAPIGKMIQALGNADWVNTGRKYIKAGSVCPFCQQTEISIELKKELDDFFSGEYELQCKQIASYNSIYSNLKDKTKALLDGVSIQESSVTAGHLDILQFEVAGKALLQAINDNLSTIKLKIDEPSRKVELNQTGNLILKVAEIINKANAEIEKHNSTVDHFQEEHDKFVENVWTFFLTENRAFIIQYNKDIANIDKAINGIACSIKKANDEINSLKEQIIEAEKNVTSTQPTVDEINRTLAAYGFTNFNIVASEQKDNSYQIQRLDGSLANDTLSEGEETFISFLYFMQLAKGTINSDQVTGKRILVLDDPICSLDSTVLYIVSAMVKELITQIRDNKSDVEQIFVLTHNVFFHKEASFINGRSSENADTHYWIIRKDLDYAVVKEYGIHNPISTSYELLWKELKENKSDSSVVIQNIMRRIIENYFGMVGNKKDDYIESSFETPEDQMICRSLLYWINDGSHCIPDDLYIDSYTPSIAKYKDVFHRIFINTDNEAHYDMMMGISDAQDDSD